MHHTSNANSLLDQIILSLRKLNSEAEQTIKEVKEINQELKEALEELSDDEKKLLKGRQVRRRKQLKSRSTVSDLEQCTQKPSKIERPTRQHPYNTRASKKSAERNRRN